MHEPERSYPPHCEGRNHRSTDCQTKEAESNPEDQIESPALRRGKVPVEWPWVYPPTLKGETARFHAAQEAYVVVEGQK